MTKLAFCFLIYDIINHEDLWHIFFKNIDTNKYNIYIHYKINKPLKYFDKYKLNNCIETTYGSIKIVEAQNILLREALHDNENKHFIFLSNSCIPFKSFDYIYTNLNEDYSYFNISPHSQCFPRCNDILNFIDKKYVQKASQWCILNRSHTEIMLKKNEYLKWFSNTTASDEHCYITNIFYNNLENEIIIPLVTNDATTFTNWYGMDYKYPSDKSLKNYQYISNEELLYLLNSKCFFGRKFNVNCEGLNNQEYINFITSE